MNWLQESAGWPDRIGRLQHESAKLPQVDCPLRHLFAPGIYMREMTIPAGTLVVGAVHKTEHYTIISKGRVLVVTDEGEVELSAGSTILSKPGAQRAALALEDTLWTTIHHNPTDCQDTSVLVPMLVHAQESQLLGGPDNAQLINAAQREELT